MQPFSSELEPPEADRALENIAAGTDKDPPVIDRYLQPVSPAPQPHQFERGAAGNHGERKRRRRRRSPAIWPGQSPNRRQMIAASQADVHAVPALEIGSI